MNLAPLVDAHCHVDLYPRPEAVVEEAEANRVFTIAVTNAPFVYAHTAALAAKSRYVRAAVGLHPELVHSHGHMIEHLRPLLDQTRYVGEVGLDYTTSDTALRQRQRGVLDRILGWCAERPGKIVTIHSRRSAADVIAAVGPNFPGAAILHWFSGSPRELDLAAEYGMFFSVNAAMARSQKGQALIARMPVQRVLTETDGPFVQERGQAVTPRSVDVVLQALASVWGIPYEEARTRVFSNFRTLLESEPLQADSAQ